MRKLHWYLPLLLIVLFVLSCGGGGGGGGVPTGAATLNWAAPTTNDDGTSITGLAGYKVHYGTSPGRYTHTINVPNPTTTTCKVINLPAGATYYFVVTAYNSSGVESAPSSEVFKKI